MQTLYFCWKTVDFLKSRKCTLMSRTCSEHISYGVALTVTPPNVWDRTGVHTKMLKHFSMSDFALQSQQSVCIIYALGRQVRLVFALSRYVSVDPHSASSHAGHSRVRQELLVHRVYTHTDKHCIRLYTATSAKWLTLSQASTQVNPW